MANSRPAGALAPKPLPAVRPGDKHLLGLIAIAEGTDDVKARRHGYRSGYEVIYDYRHGEKPITGMTLEELDELQSRLGEHTPVGRYQLLRRTVQGLRREFGLSGRDVFSPALQDHLGRVQMSKRRYDDPAASAADIQTAFSMEWASIPDITGRSHYTIKRRTQDGVIDVHQPTGVSSADFQEALATARRLNGAG